MKLTREIVEKAAAEEGVVDAAWQEFDDAVTPQAVLEIMDERDALREKYNDLLYEVATKFPDESRHETAKRYIGQMENRDSSPAMENPEALAKGGE